QLSGLTVESAKTALQSVKLTAETGSEVYSDSVEAGRVIGIVAKQDGPVRPGDSVFITISKGPELFPIPDVSGKTKGEATTILEDAGFGVSYSYRYPFYVREDEVPDEDTRVTGMDPAAGTNVKK